jgi:ABC-2 type transport system permease protein
MMGLSTSRIGAVVRKELTEFRRSRFIVVTMAVFPILFLIQPTAIILASKAAVDSTKLDYQVGASLMVLLLIPLFMPAAIAAYSVVGERDQGTLEPVLTTPIRREEFLIGKAAANFIPAVVLAYLVYGIFLAIVAIGAKPVIATAIWHAPQLIAEVFYIPLLAGWAIWMGLAVSTKASDTRVAQQLSTLASLPPIVLIALMSFQVVRPTLTIALSLAGLLLVIDCVAYLFVARLFDRERLITGTKPGVDTTAPGY